jgi:pimeloyl-ACP methyl ester carboxylesterase
VQPLFEHRLHVEGPETRALELEGDGPGLILLHGWGDSADTWRPLLAELGARDRRAIAVDLLEATERLLELLLPFPAAVPA